MYGCIVPKPNEKIVGADFGLYSITFTNNLDEEHYALREFHEFRLEAERSIFPSSHSLSSKCFAGSWIARSQPKKR